MAVNQVDWELWLTGVVTVLVTSLQWRPPERE
jgi:hypothetical protein